VDQQGMGSEAFSLLVPADWGFTGGIRWQLDCPAMPGVVSFVVSNPAGPEALELFPNRMFFWSGDASVRSFFPRGSRYMGAEVEPPASALDYLQELVRQRRRGVESLRILEAKAQPELGRSLASPAPPVPGATATTDAASLRIEYQRNGTLMEEEVYAILQFVNVPAPTMYGMTTNTIWMADYQFSFQSRKGQLDSAAKIFQTMIRSFKFDIQWFNAYNQVVQQLTQGQLRQIQQAGELSRYISRTSNEISDMIRDSYERQQSTYDHVFENYSQQIRGVDAYYDPIQEKPVELPTGYREAWTNPLGEYIVSDDPNYSPNVGANGNWQKLQKKD
jgi:hypothetical protein